MKFVKLIFSYFIGSESIFPVSFYFTSLHFIFNISRNYKMIPDKFLLHIKLIKFFLKVGGGSREKKYEDSRLTALLNFTV